ncbi:MAG: hypothetical protein PHW13_05425 [Methylococcales bacterium]|nr:hypothetical protein [Methylococcales bacterium]
MNICLQTLKTWLKKAKLNSSRDRQTKLKRPQDWRPEERLAALQKSYELSGEDFNAFANHRAAFNHLVGTRQKSHPG